MDIPAELIGVCEGCGNQFFKNVPVKRFCSSTCRSTHLSREVDRLTLQNQLLRQYADDVLHMPIEGLGLSVPAHNILKNGGIKNLDQLVLLTELDLLRFPQCGPAKAREISEAVASVSLRLGMAPRQRAKLEE